MRRRMDTQVGVRAYYREATGPGRVCWRMFVQGQTTWSKDIDGHYVLRTNEKPRQIPGAGRLWVGDAALSDMNAKLSNPVSRAK